MFRWNIRCAVLIALAISACGLAGCAGTPSADDQAGVAELYDRAAVSRFEDLAARFPFGDYSVQSQLMIIYAHHLAGQHQSTIAAADRFIRMHPQNANAAYAMYMRGVSRQAIGPGGLGQLMGVNATLRDPEPKRRAFLDFQELVHEFPDSEYVADAHERMAKIREQLAAYELYIAEFYLDRDAYIVAANRATHIISGYPGTAAVDDAMKNLATAYRGLGLTELSEQVEREIERRHKVDIEDIPEVGGVN